MELNPQKITGGEGSGRRPRVLLVAPFMDMVGGQAVQAARLLGRLGDEPSVEVGFLPINPPLPGPLRRAQSVKYVRSVRTSALYWAELLRRVPRYDVLHIFSASYLSFVVSPTPAILAAKLYGKKVLLNYRSGEAADHLRRWGRTAIPTLRLADEIVVPSGYLVDVFRDFGLRARAIFNFVETERFRFRRRLRLRPIFLTNRSLEPLYNVGCSLRAFALVQRRFPEARLVVAGDGSRRAELERLARELNLQNTEFVGRVAPADMPALYEAADIYLNSPNIDNMPGSIIEAFAAGLPVVTTDAGGIPYIVSHEETGLMVGRDDHEAMAACAVRLLETPALAQSLTDNALAACRRYSWEAVRAEWLAVYHRLYAREEAPAGGVREVDNEAAQHAGRGR